MTQCQKSPVAAQIRHLADLDLTQLRNRWRETFNRSPPVAARQDYLTRALAQHLQEQTEGGLAPSARRQLAKLMADQTNKEKVARSISPKLRPGSRLLREWQGTTHEVSVTVDGFVYRAKPYKSLSEIARLITGTRWSGPLFFGLRPGGNQPRPGNQDRSYVVDLTSKSPSALKKSKSPAGAPGAHP
jgi:hypothetical protein